MKKAIAQISITDPELIKIFMDSIGSGTATTYGGNMVVVEKCVKELTDCVAESMTDLKAIAETANIIERDKFKIIASNFTVKLPDHVLKMPISNITEIFVTIELIHPLWWEYADSSKYTLSLVPRMIRAVDEPGADFDEPINTTTYLGFDLLVTPKSVSKTKTTTKGGSNNGSRKKSKESTEQNHDKR